VDLRPGFGSGAGQAGIVTFVDDGSVEDVSAEGGLQEGGGVGFEGERLKCGELVDGGEDSRV